MVDGCGGDDDCRSLRDIVPADGGILGGLAECESYWCVEAEDFIAEGVKEGETVESFRCYWSWVVD